MCEHVTRDTKREQRGEGGVNEHQEKEEEEEEGAYAQQAG